MLQEGLFSLLSSEASIVAHLGAPGERSEGTSGVFSLEVPEKPAVPHIVISQVFGEGEQTHDFATTFHRARIQVSCYGIKFKQAKQLGGAVRRFLEGWHGVMSDGTEVDSTFWVSEIDLYEDDSTLFNCALDFEFAYRDVGT